MPKGKSSSSKAGARTNKEALMEDKFLERKLSELPTELKEIDVNKVNTGARKRLDYGNINELQVSITQKGLIHPIAVMKYEETFEGFDYFLLAGGRRLRAVQGLKWKKISARIYPSGLGPYEIRVIELEENIRRKSMTDAEYLKSVKDIHDLWVEKYGKKVSTGMGSTGHSMKDTAKRLNLSVGKVSEDIKIADYLEEVPELAKLKDRSAIKKAIKNAEKSVVVDKQVKEYEKEVIEKGEDELKALLIRSYIVGDTFDLIKKIPKNTIDLVNIDIDFPIETEDNPLHSMIEEDKTQGIYTGIAKEDYPKQMKTIMKESFRILKEEGWAIIWFGREYFDNLQKWGEEIGFRTHWYTGRWCQGSGYSSTRLPYYRLGNSIQEFFYFSKGTGHIIIPHADEFRFPPTPLDARIHPYEKPIELMEDILSTFIHPGSRVIDTFAGSGHCLIAGHNLKCHAVGFDLSTQCKKRYTAKISLMK